MPYIKNTYNLQNNNDLNNSRSKKKKSAHKTKDSSLDKDFITFNKGFDPFTITRRHFIYGLAGIAAFIGIGSGVKMLTDNAKSKNAISTIEVPQSSFKLSDDLTQIDSDNHVKNILEAKLDYGTNCWCNSDNFTLALVPNDEGRPLNSIKFISHSNANQRTALQCAVNYDKNFEIYDARANDNGLCWVEANILDNHWILYASELKSDGSMASPIELDSSKNDKQMPAICVSGSYVFWQLSPLDPSTSDRCELKKSSFNKNNTETIYTSSGPFACGPYMAKDGVVICPMAASAATIYQPTYIDAQTNKVIDQIGLPTPIKPLLATYGIDGFSFALDQIYKGSNGIGQLGTYTPYNMGVNKDYDSANWFRFNKTPSAAPVNCGDYYVVKSRASICCINLNEMSYFTIDPPVGSADFGNFIIQSGIVENLAYTSNVNHVKTDGSSDKYTYLCVCSIN
ncbi:MAG: hypothetical protein HUJ63_02985 [Enterococcus sp.]|nr:hypothetical protein [Enterococcus sp.]